MHNRRRFMALSAAVFATELSRVGEARTIDRPARLLVGFPAGSSPDFVARLIAEHIKEYASTVVVDNRPGAGGRLPLEALKAAERDGSVMVLTPGDQVALFPHVYAKLGYDSRRDFAPVSTLCTVQLRALAVTAPKRSPVLPAVPTIREAGYPAAEGVEFFELFVPAGTPENMVARLNAQVRDALDTDALREGLAKQWFEPAPSTPAELGQLVESDVSRWGAIVKKTGFKPID